MERRPYDCRMFAVELDERAHDLKHFVHPDRAIYLLGAEDYGLSESVLSQCQGIIQINGAEDCLNVASAGSIVMYDRLSKSLNKETP